MKALLKRNIKLYFRDKANVFFSMLSVLLIVALFALFLGQGNWGSDEIRDSWLMAGILAVAALTTALGATSVIVEDKVNKITKGFYASPIKRSRITAAYILCPFIVSVIMTTITAVAFGVYIVAIGGDMPGIAGLLQLAGLMLLSSITATAIVCFFVSFIKTNSVFGSVSAIVGTLSGFLMGIYMPIGNLPSAIQTVIMLFPPAHAASLFRQILMERPMELALEAAPELDLPELQEVLGVVFRFGDFEITPVMSIAFLAASAILFFGLSVMNMRKAGKS
ncbi:MAG: ABC transporter permease [Clostridiales bacterium]|jgi:multidrug/hemolysin transport system permease protein|nr:ABC transporter permease [Clostridiales bacterium]